MCRRGESIYKRKDGRWEARYIKGRTSDGKAIYGYVYAKTYREAKVRRDATAHAKDDTLESGMLYSDVVIQWLSNIKLTVKESTYHCYKKHSKNHIIPELGDIKASRIDLLSVSRFLNNKLKNGRIDGCGGLSSKTCNELLNVIKQSAHYGALLGVMSPIDFKIKLPSTPRKIEILSKSEEGRIMSSIVNNNIGIAIVLALYCGLRIGEICALNKQDVDLKNRTISIDKTLYRITQDEGDAKTKIIVSNTKTESGKRIVPVPQCIHHILEPHTTGNGFLLNNDGKHLEPRLITSQFTNFLKSNELRHIHFHVLRHTFASKCVELGFDYKALSEILGHSKTSTTMNLYVHTNQENKQKYMDRLSIISSQ